MSITIISPGKPLGVQAAGQGGTAQETRHHAGQQLHGLHQHGQGNQPRNGVQHQAEHILRHKDKAQVGPVFPGGLGGAAHVGSQERAHAKQPRRNAREQRHRPLEHRGALAVSPLGTHNPLQPQPDEQHAEHHLQRRGGHPLSSSVPGMHPARSTAHTGRAFFH